MKIENNNANEPTARAQCKDAERFVPTVMTAGMALYHGAIVEQIAGGRLLLLADGRHTLHRAVQHCGVRYVPLPLGPDYERALLMPDATAEYGTVGELQHNLSSCSSLRSRNVNSAIAFLKPRQAPKATNECMERSKGGRSLEFARCNRSMESTIHQSLSTNDQLRCLEQFTLCAA